MPRVVAVSDLHTHLPQVPPCDLLVVAGDVSSMFAPLELQQRFLAGPFSDWLSEVPAKAIAGVSGNHELVGDAFLRELPWDYLAGETRTLGGLIVHGLPWTSRFADMHHQDQLGRDLRDDLPPRYRAVPDGIDVLVSHQPPAGLRDAADGGPSRGSEALRWTIERARPRLCVVGHIHGAHGSAHHHGTIVVNAALAGEDDDRPAHRPVVIDL